MRVTFKTFSWRKIWPVFIDGWSESQGHQYLIRLCGPFWLEIDAKTPWEWRDSNGQRK